jgi:hypothetical protein
MRSIAKQLTALEKRAARPAAAELPAPVLFQKGEVDALASELARQFQDTMESYKKHFGLSHEEAVARANASCPEAVNNVRRVPPERLAWRDLETYLFSASSSN